MADPLLCLSWEPLYVRPVPDRSPSFVLPAPAGAAHAPEHALAATDLRGLAWPELAPCPVGFYQIARSHRMQTHHERDHSPRARVAPTRARVYLSPWVLKLTRIDPVAPSWLTGSRTWGLLLYQVAGNGTAVVAEGQHCPS